MREPATRDCGVSKTWARRFCLTTTAQKNGPQFATRFNSKILALGQRDGEAAALLPAPLPCTGALRSLSTLAVFAGATAVLELSSSFVTMGRRSWRMSAGVGLGAEPTLRFIPV